MNRLLHMLRESDLGVLVRREYWRHRGMREMEKYDDYTFLCKKYRSLGRELNLKNPLRYTEKQQWLKLFYRNDLMPIVSDKYEVRSYMCEKGYGHLLNNLLSVYERVEDFDPAPLPARFVLKAVHGSGWNLIVKDKNEVNWFLWKKIMRSWLRQNLYWFGREWNYRDQKPRIIAEEYMEDDSGELRDYKVFCMNGEPRFFQIDEGRQTNHKRVYTDCDGNPTDFSDSQTSDQSVKIHFRSPQREMARIAEDLCVPFPLVRIDFYECGGKVYFGEMTFFGGSGFFRFTPDEVDYEWGAMIRLPEPNYNLELYEKIQQG